MNFIVASTDSYYSEALVKMEAKTLINQYSDVHVLQSWQRTNEGGIQIQLSVEGETMIIDYTESIQKFSSHGNGHVLQRINNDAKP